MRNRNLSIGLTAAALVALTVVGTATRAAAQTQTVLFSFNQSNPGDGLSPHGTLTLDAAGNLYGTTTYGGVNGFGTVYELTPSAGGGWTEKVLHNFSETGVDGIAPESGVILDASGNLYGTTSGGSPYGCGTVFKLKPTPHGGWIEEILYSFTGCTLDGAGPQGSLIFDAVGNLYGTTSLCGAHNYGSVFELTPTAGGGWAERTLHSFNDNGTDGYDLRAGSLALDAAGNLYGTTFGGGTYGYGTVFELKHNPAGGWSEQILHSFNDNGTDGYNHYLPNGVVLDASGNLYGTTDAGGTSDFYGVVFELSRNAAGGWGEKILHNFTDNGTDGLNPSGGLIWGASGKLYGITEDGGAYYIGTVFEMTPTPTGGWAESVPYTFNGNGTNSFFPNGGLALDSSGNLYGTTNGGGAYDSGTVFEITP
jgi:uncharacterized repeat protein (TIGR03803 family)